ncbi:hypothetical protein MTO98_01975 [Mucilaginibacter sp. SMC90]|uniref:hypothetical protein n=1 Tax=Mucilaginibacter TaxID=423349 RepID=UPI00131D7B65|nr:MULTISPECIES: hypothetical protein [unclassified Mucilaginibacter]MBS7565700.1 hypothetical protein [Mucilaginibacter sp. Bleaf8]UOE49837.1 hypothetical protein MTO98_01975 [Mucilaginibacter sp. SMC90]
MGVESQIVITATLAGGSELHYNVTHLDETFVVETGNGTITLINNGDNSWSIVNGDISQESANIIGQAIEDHYRKNS